MGLDDLRVIFLAVAGLILGSFAGCLSYRYVVGVSVANPARSYCPKCKAFLEWRDNLPLLSYCLLRGKCRHCGHPIGLQYFLIECSSLICAVLLAVRYDSLLQWGVAMTVLFLLIVSTAIEIETQRIPRFVTVGILAVAIGLASTSPRAILYQTILGTGAGLLFSSLYFRIVGRAVKVKPGSRALMVGTAATIGCFAEAGPVLAALIMCTTYGMVVFLTYQTDKRDGVPCSAISAIGCLVAMLWM